MIQGSQTPAPPPPAKVGPVAGRVPVAPVRLRAVLVVVLTVVTGVTDAIGFTKLGGVFTSVMTGNMVLLGVAVGRGSMLLALHTGVAFLAYIAGGFAGAHIAGTAEHDPDVWPRRVTITLAVELGVLTTFAVAWEATGGRPAAGVTSLLIAVNAIGLGVQSSAVLRFGVSGLSTTYLTGTLTTVLTSIARRDRFATYARSVAILCALVGGACIGALTALRAPLVAPFFQVVPLTAVVAIGAIAFRGSEPSSEPAGALPSAAP
ncbi:MAG TPA: YoaK family protein [Acidimicrobiales bacterium]|nr:YoaK family protein [Acidimicrobiales bacterium]